MCNIVHGMPATVLFSFSFSFFLGIAKLTFTGTQAMRGPAFEVDLETGEDRMQTISMDAASLRELDVRSEIN